MLNLNPSLHFQKVHPAYAEELYKAVRTPWLNAALIHSMAEMGRGNATSEELKGARIFIATLLNLSEEVAPVLPSLPPKELGQKPNEKLEPKEQ